MNDRFVGDVGDFAKLGLLRFLAGVVEPAARLGVVWCTTRVHRGAQGDGRHVDYLSRRQEEFEPLDPELHAGLSQLVQSGARTIGALELSLVWPAGTIFSGRPLDASNALPPGRRQAARSEWCLESATDIAASELVFLDPDNGLAGASVRPTQGQARLSVFASELPSLVGAAQSLVLYHHETRQGSRHHQAEWLRQELRRALPGHGAPRVLRFHRYSARFFTVVPAQARIGAYEKALAAFLASRWSSCFRELAR